MKYLSLRTFLGAKDYEVSRQIYRDLDFSEEVLSEKMCFYSNARMGFYLQDYYVQDWADNTMMFMQVDDVEGCRT